jgi:hypothetical protein
MLAKLPTLIQTRHGPDRYVPSIFFDTMPSAPRRHAWANGDVLVQQDAGLGIAQQARQHGLSPAAARRPTEALSKKASA